MDVRRLRGARSSYAIGRRLILRPTWTSSGTPFVTLPNVAVCSSAYAARIYSGTPWRAGWHKVARHSRRSPTFYATAASLFQFRSEPGTARDRQCEASRSVVDRPSISGSLRGIGDELHWDKTRSGASGRRHSSWGAGGQRRNRVAAVHSLVLWTAPLSTGGRENPAIA